MQIIPAIDLIDGKCVRLSMGNYAHKTVYSEDPLATAQQFEQAGLQRLHLVDLDGAKAGRIVNGAVLEQICRHTSLIVDFGGGISTDTELEKAYALGATMVTAGSVAVRQPERVLRWLEVYGPDRLILGADARDGRIAVAGWQEDSGLDIITFLRSYYTAGFRQVISTDIARDGMLQGPSYKLYESLLTHYPELRLIASGGIAHSEDLAELQRMGLHGAIVGKAYYEGKISLAELSSYVN